MIFLIFFTMLLAAIGLIYLDIERRKEHEATIRALTISNVDNMNGTQFEHYVARLLKNEGFTGIIVTPHSNDKGVDLTACKDEIRYSIQAKRHAKSVSRAAVSDAVAGKDYYHCNAAMVVTNNYLSPNAREFALAVNCRIVDRDTLVEWIKRYQSRGPGRLTQVQ
ncbi:MAG: restriction endonuclease [Planctomycetes bacterium]|nr:restriction endonuclease [Planctomycetota bacterium]